MQQNGNAFRGLGVPRDIYYPNGRTGGAGVYIQKKGEMDFPPLCSKNMFC